MATRIRLQRHGKKGKPFFHIVAADSRSKRDGRFIEKLGTYDPTKNPAVINLKFENTLSWVQKGAELTDTARAILSYKGVLYKNHLLKGVVKGALTEADVEKKFEAWLKEKEAKIQAKIDGLNKSAAKAKSDKLKSESAAKEARAAAIIEKNTPAPEEAPVEAATEEAPAEAATEEAPAEAARLKKHLLRLQLKKHLLRLQLKKHLLRLQLKKHLLRLQLKKHLLRLQLKKHLLRLQLKKHLQKKHQKILTKRKHHLLNKQLWI